MLAIVMVLTASCTTNDDPGFEYLRLQVDGQSTLAITKNDVLIRGIVVFFHGLNQNEFSLTSDQPHKTVTEKLLNAGFAVVASSAGGNAFGDPATLRNYRELGSMAREHYRIENIYFLAESIGAIPAVNLLASDYTSVRGFAAISPALNFDSATPEWPALAAKSPGGPPEPVNPMNLPLDAMKGKSIRFYISPQDTLVRPADNALAFQQHYGPVANISTVNCSGGHGDPSCLKGDDLVKWFAQLDQRS
jgi:pimeloyl-ACP methyl ester carboxylesterase